MNQPVAWMTTIYRDDNLLGRVKIPQFHQTKPPSHFYDEIIPLYTHPAKTLTDEEIMKTMKELKGNFWEGNFMVDFARAILKKANEK